MESCGGGNDDQAVWRCDICPTNGGVLPPTSKAKACADKGDCPAMWCGATSGPGAGTGPVMNLQNGCNYCRVFTYDNDDHCKDSGELNPFCENCRKPAGTGGDDDVLKHPPDGQRPIEFSDPSNNGYVGFCNNCLPGYEFEAQSSTNRPHPMGGKCVKTPLPTCTKGKQKHMYGCKAGADASSPYSPIGPGLHGCACAEGGSSCAYYTAQPEAGVPAVVTCTSPAGLRSRGERQRRGPGTARRLYLLQKKYESARTTLPDEVSVPGYKYLKGGAVCDPPDVNDPADSICMISRCTPGTRE